LDTLTTPDLPVVDSGDRERVVTLADLGPISPELVLVDPELARLLRGAATFPRAPQPESQPLPQLEAGVPGLANVPTEHYERWGYELGMFFAPAATEALPSSQYDVRPLAGRLSPAAVRPAAHAPRRRERRIRRRVGVVVAALVLGGSGAALGGLVTASSPDARSSEGVLAPATADATSPASPAPLSSAPPTGPAPSAPAPPSPPPQELAQQPRILAWAPARGAAAYEVALYRGSRQIFLKRTRQTRLALPAEWTHRGRRRRLERGVYRWYVWPVPAGARKAAARPVVQASLTITAA
jgi:hypothetical protein